MTSLATPRPGKETSWVATHLGHLCCDTPERSTAFDGTQAAADGALARFDVSGYAARRNEVWPVDRRGASGLSPWIRHGLLTLPRVWESVDGPGSDRAKFRDELLWQEYARHLYARLGTELGQPLRYDPPVRPSPVVTDVGVTIPGGPWDRSMACFDTVLTELERDGWLVNQTRMWLAGDWAVRHGADWTLGEGHFFAHLLDGSRAANRAGWQWTIGTAGGRPYGFSRFQVEKRAPSLCRGCAKRTACPIQEWPDAEPGAHREPNPLLDIDPDPATTSGPDAVLRRADPDTVWLTAESIGDDDPALVAHPTLPVVFVFDERLLKRLMLSGKRLVFLAQRLAELGSQRPLEVFLGHPADVLADRQVAVTFAPVPGWRRLSVALDPSEIHPWPWLRRPGPGSVVSYSAWRRGL